MLTAEQTPEHTDLEIDQIHYNPPKVYQRQLGILSWLEKLVVVCPQIQSVTFAAQVNSVMRRICFQMELTGVKSV